MLAMTMLAAGKKAKGRQAITGSLHWNFPDQKRLGELCLVQADDRNYLESIERNGATGRVVELLRSMVESREIEINALLANGRFP
jgi:hypothetical protein